MIFTSSDLASLLHRWELAEYISEAFVILACAGELVADFGKIQVHCPVVAPFSSW
jgi:hypothetical protein